LWFFSPSDSMRYRDTLKSLKQSDIVPIVSGGTSNVPVAGEVFTPKSVAIPISKEARYPLSCVRDSLNQVKNIKPLQGFKKFVVEIVPAKDRKRGPNSKDPWKELPQNFWGRFKSPLGCPD